MRDFARLRDPCLKTRDRITKVQDFETVQCAVSPRFRDSCLECQDFETGLIFSEIHYFLIDHSTGTPHMGTVLLDYDNLPGDSKSKIFE